MFSPPKLWSLTPRSDSGQKNGSISGKVPGLNSTPSNGPASSKGEAVAFVGSGVNMNEQSLAERISNLENELFEYQYNLGLLLIEKKEWASKYEEMKESSVEAAEALKGEQALHLSAMSEAEKREENLKKALGVERQCVLELEKALREIRSEYAEIKFNADSKLAEAGALVASVEEKSWEVEAKSHAADTKLAEVNRKSTEIEMKLFEIEAQEAVLRRERLSFNSERVTHETTLSKKREDLREWEQKLQEAEERLADGGRLLNQREERANENDKILKQKQSDLEELQRKIEEAECIQKSLEAKEKMLLELEEKLNARERLEIQSLVDEHKAILAKKQEEYEVEVEQKRKLHDEQLKNKVVELENKEVEIVHMEKKVKRREEAVEKKMEKMREKEITFESKSNALKEREKLLKVEAKSLEKEREQVLAEKELFLSIKAGLENRKAEIEKQELRLIEEREQLKITEDERLEHARLQSELKQEIEKCRYQSEQLMKEIEELKKEKEKFEKEWEQLDEKRASVKRELEDAHIQKRSLEKFRHSEVVKVNNEKQETQQYIQRELESLKLAKDNFAANMEHEKLMLAEKFQNEKSELFHDFELRKRELETEVRKKQEEMESALHEKEMSFEKESENERNNINYLRELARREMEEMKLERLGIDKEKLDISHIKKHIESQQIEMKKDVEELVGLSKKLKDQREHFLKERERFITFVQNQKSCNICGEIIREFLLSDLHQLPEIKNLEAPQLPRVTENYLEADEGTFDGINDESTLMLVNSGSPAAGGSATMSWLRKCTSKIFKLSPGKKLELDYDPNAYGKKIDVPSPETLPSNESGPKPSQQDLSDSFDVQIIESDSGIREVEAVQTPSVDQDSGLKARRRRGKGGKPRASRTRAAKALIAGAKAALGQSIEEKDININGDTENSAFTIEESQAESGLVEIPGNRRKRNHLHLSHATVSDSHSEGHSDGVEDGNRRRRRQKVVAAEQRFVEKRYNLRRSTRPVVAAANGSLPEAEKGEKKETDVHIGRDIPLPGISKPTENEIDAANGSLPEAEKGEKKETDVHIGRDIPLPGISKPTENEIDTANGSLPEAEKGEKKETGVHIGKDIPLPGISKPTENEIDGASREEIDALVADFVPIRSPEKTIEVPADSSERPGGIRSGHDDLANTSEANKILCEEANGSAGTMDDSIEEMNSVSYEEEDENT
ncbi:nuclear matrix constituent protein 1-like protein [Dorcoceras hygrometricum]|uniref:Nuclear matrix constituent protein 1-like protein n=1 Tax=Dorcoceras hygrometricum TaxID=472368 RepID=A0A2Z7CI61_9LAMI|nr:nuclear matrix constituent protein 1-like protein [Dorcoceras hygrometricum]